jgi:hypothetical protein
MTSKIIGLIFLAIFSLSGHGCKSQVRGTDSLVSKFEQITEATDVAPIWSAHAIGRPELITSGNLQYVGYYDDERRLTIAQRKLNSKFWTYHVFPVKMGWATGSHAKLSMVIDRDGYIHMSSYRRSLILGPPAPPQKIYYRSVRPHDISEFERLIMVSDEEAPAYPTFIKGQDDELFFTYRQGSSGRGDQIFNIYDHDTRLWARLYDTPLFDGQGKMNAYGGPTLGKDGLWHATWVWRHTPCNSTNHFVSYARSKDMRNWETIDGSPVRLPITNETQGVVVDPAGTGEGISNMTSGGLGWDSRGRVIRTYHKFDGSGNSQVYNARFENGKWKIVQATNWAFRWNYEGTGALPSVVRVGNVSAGSPGKLELRVWSSYHENELIELDEKTLEPLRVTKLEDAPEWRKALEKPELDFIVSPDDDLLRSEGPMTVEIIDDNGESNEESVRYILRWENAGVNRDRPVPKPWPQPTMLRVYKISN